jgi:F5/8 type C domain/Bacterial alpha-L-rhamnosidase 6 hairpin glycosidase domain
MTTVSNRRAIIAVVITLFAIATPSLPAFANPPKTIDDFTDPARWKVVASEGVELKCSESPEAAGEHSSTLRLDINFVTGAGYAGIRRELPLDLPPNFELGFSIRGDLPPNNLEFKLTDATGETVWWVNRRTFEFPHDWTRLTSRRRHFQFAWGPSDALLTRAAAIEIVISSAQGGHGTLYLDDLTFRTLPQSKKYEGTPTLSASSQASPGAAPPLAFDGNPKTEWQSAANDRAPTFTIDFGASREFGGLVIDWDPAAYVHKYEIKFSDDGENWATARTLAAATGRRQLISLPDSEARAIRLEMSLSDDADHVAIRDIEVLPLDTSRDANAFAAEIAKRAPRGHYPRSIIGEGLFWTVVGAPADDHEALFSEDGAAEVDHQAFSIEPFLYCDGQFLTWADATTTQSLAAGFAPVPTVTRAYAKLKLAITAAADGNRNNSSLLLNYTVTNTSSVPTAGSLFLAIRPLQVNPPYQWLKAPGGVARINSISLRDSKRAIDVDDRVIALGDVPTNFGAATFDEGDVSSFISASQSPPNPSVTDPQRTASAAIEYRFDLKPGESRSWVVSVPFSQDKSTIAQLTQPLLSAADPIQYVRARQKTVVDEWTRATDSYDLLLPPEATEIANTIRSTLAYILINRDGPSIQPGSRSYERSWIRDGSLTATALLRFGMDKPAREFVEWYAPYQFASGKVPCVVDHRGPDPVPENDSHGQLIMAVMNIYRFTGDESILREQWPRVQKAVAYIEELRAQRMTPDYADPDTIKTHQEPGKPAVNFHAFYGLLPESISHEGYSAKAMHSYWDDFFALKGLKDAAEMAHILGHDDEAKQYKTYADEFAATLYASLDAVMKVHAIDFLPGCVELGDFDATSTTTALWPCGELSRIPRKALDRTFDVYWERFLRRRDDPTFKWEDYTPYELRTIGSFVLLGHPDRAQQALEFFLHDRRPPAWNQWPEVVYREPRTAKFLGDLPHTWCGSDFLNSVRMMFLYEREADNSLVLFAGVPESWITTNPVGFKGMPTYGGRITCTVERRADDNGRLTVNVAGSCPVPTGGIRLTLPLSASQATANGKPADLDADGRIVVRELPARIEVAVATKSK